MIPLNRRRAGQADAVSTGWGRSHRSPARKVELSPTTDPLRMLSTVASGRITTRGCGSSYGDAATVDGGTVLLMTARDRVLLLDTDQGVLTAQSGITLGEILAVTSPHGWSPPVLAGTPHVTLGGAVAADIHGKNHPAAGSIGCHIDSLLVLGGDLKAHRLDAATRPQEFWATVGGLGLTGPILEVALRLQRIGGGPARTTRRKARSLRQIMQQLDESQAHPSPLVHSVAWVDATSSALRGLVDTTTVPDAGDAALERAAGAWPLAAAAESPEGARRRRDAALRARSAASLPGPGLVGRTPIRAAAVGRWYAPRAHHRDAALRSALMPLTHAEHWPRLFGSRGLTQYQFVVPAAHPEAVAAAMRLLVRRRLPPALAVLKRLGPGDPAPLGFAQDGWTLAVDLPSRWDGLEEALRELDRLVIAAGGRVYLAKDRRLAPESFHTMYPSHRTWRQTRDAMDPDGLFGSDLSRRLDLTP